MFTYFEESSAKVTIATSLDGNAVTIIIQKQDGTLLASLNSANGHTNLILNGLWDKAK